jgi:aryl-alcohol dehydrogenase-like predicted oxidoreductase
MQKRKLGNLEVSSIGLGCMGMSHAYGTAPDTKEMVKILHKAVDLGCTFFDTAECYTGVFADGSIANNEELVGEGLAPYRSKVILATKFGIIFGESGATLDSSPAKIRTSIEGSLKRLKTDYIDLYYQHRQDPDTAVEEVAGVMKELIKEGKIRYWGLSETDADTIRRAHKVCPVTALQSRYSMIVRHTEKEIIPTLEELGIGYVPHGPLGNGLLSGKYDKSSEFEDGVDYRSRMPHFAADKIETNLTLVHLLEEIGKGKGATPAQVAIAWVLVQKPWIVPIPGTRKEERLAENFGADSVSLSPTEVARINDKAIEVFGSQILEEPQMRRPR